jgi:ketosteroid isomerase-like protein
MDHEKPRGPVRNPQASGHEGELAHNPAVDDFFRRLNQDLHHPKPGNEAIAAALQAVQRLTSQVDADASASASTVAESMEFRVCPSCGNRNPAENRFCAICGVPQDSQVRESGPAPGPQPSTLASGQHHYHHHYHHHYFASSEAGVPATSFEQRATGSVPVVRDARQRSQPGGASLNRAEAAVRKLAQDWIHACNSKQLDDLVGLYAFDAVVLRANVPPVRGAGAIREFFFGALDSGFGEVEMDPLRTEVFGDIAYEAGRCKMLVPFMGKRREERGKYLLTLARQGVDWKILADCWSSDLSLGVSADSVSAKPNAPTSGASNVKPPHKGA